MEQSRAFSQIDQDQINLIKKSLVTNIIKHDASLKDLIEVYGN
jgi:hypothetical protein